MVHLHMEQEEEESTGIQFECSPNCILHFSQDPLRISPKICAQRFASKINKKANQSNP